MNVNIYTPLFVASKLNIKHNVGSKPTDKICDKLYNAVYCITYHMLYQLASHAIVFKNYSICQNLKYSVEFYNCM